MSSGDEASTLDESPRLAQGEPFQPPAASGPARAVPQAQGPGDAPGDREPADFSTLSLEDLLSLSVAGEERPEEEEEEEDKDDAEDETPAEDRPPAEEWDADQQDGEGDAGSDGGAGLFLELQAEPADWLSQQDEGARWAGGGLYLGADPGVAPGAGPAGGAYSLRLGVGPQAPIGGQPVPDAGPDVPADPIQAWFTPFAMDLVGGTVGESWSVAETVGRVRASGGGAPVSYLLVDDAGGRFAVDGASGEVTIVGGPFDFAARTGLTIVVEATDGARTLQRSFTLQISPGDGDGTGLPGDQVLTGALGMSDDALHGGAGDDVLSGLNGDDRLHGGSGDDILVGGNHDDALFGGSGDDILLGGNHADSLNGGTGDDLLQGGNHDDALIGGGGGDRLEGGEGSDRLHGEGGNDRLDGGAGSDRLMGGADDDGLVWDAADGLIDGGGGDDVLLVLAGDADLTGFGGELAGLETVDLRSDAGPNALSLTVADVLDMTDSGLLAVLGDDQDRVIAEPGWTLAQVDGDGHRLYVHSVGPGEVAGLLLDPGVQFDPQDGG